MPPSVRATTRNVTPIMLIFQRYIIWPARSPIKASITMPSGTSGRADRVAARIPTNAPASSIR
jgi:hypothetical protein